jgi:quercetin dioxygenase-like cupin family protein
VPVEKDQVEEMMITANLNNLELNEFWGKNHPTQHARATFPLLGAMGTENVATVYFEIEPGDNLGRHTDSAEEILLILQGTVEATIGEEQGRLAQGEMVVVPTMVPHDVRNTGENTAKVLGFFASANIVATFDVAWLPNDSNVIDTAAMTAQNAGAAG